MKPFFRTLIQNHSFRVLLWALLLLGAAARCAAQQPDAPPQIAEDSVAARIPDRFILDSVRVTTADLYEGVQRTWVVSDLLEFFHTVTKERAIRQELFVDIGDTVTAQDLDELEENLRLLGIFAMVRFEVEPLPDRDDEEIPRARLVVHTRDVISLRGGLSYTQSQDSRNFFAGLREYNMFGMAKQFGASITYTTLNDLGWAYSLSYLNPNVFGTHADLLAEVSISGRQRAAELSGGRTYFSDRTPNAYNATAFVFDGDLIYDVHSGDSVLSLTGDVNRTYLAGWFSSARNNAGSVFTTSARVSYDRTIHHTPGIPVRAFENSAGVFVGIGSRRRTFTKVVNADFNGLQQVPIGGMGSVTVGKISPHSGGLDNVIYIGADARQAVRIGDFYGFASIEAGTGLEGKKAKFTSERAVASGVLLLNPGAIAARLEQSTVWNWPRYLYVPLDNANFLRGTPRLESFGDNRVVFNLEYRLNPIFRLILFDIGAAAFYDVGTTWLQGTDFAKTRFRSGAGIGLRVSNADAVINKGFLRIDLAYSFEEKRFARLIISTVESFNAFGNLDYRPPGPY